MDETELTRTPLMVYGANLLAAGTAYYLMQRAIYRAEGNESLVREAVGRDLKGKLSPVIYLLAILSALLSPWLAVGLYALVAALWLVPDRRMEAYVAAHG